MRGGPKLPLCFFDLKTINFVLKCDSKEVFLLVETMLKKFMICLSLLGIAAQASELNSRASIPAGPEHLDADVKNMSLEEIKQLHSKGYLFEYDDAIDFARSGNLDVVKFFFEDVVKEEDPSAVEAFAEDMFWEAMQSDQIEVLKYLLEKNPKLVDAENEYRQTALSLAANEKKTEVVELLVKKAAEIESKPFFFDAVLLGQVDAVKYLLEQNPELINAKNDNGETPLWYVEKNKIRGFWDLLVKKGIEKGGKLFFFDAIKLGAVDAVECLLEKDSGLANTIDELGKTPLWYAVEGGEGERFPRLVNLLIEKGASVNDKYLLFKAICYFNRNKGIMSTPYIVKSLLDKDQTLANATDDKGTTPLWYAVDGENRSLIRLLVEKGAKVDEASLFRILSKTRNHYINYEILKIVNCLLNANPDLINAKDENGKTPLEITVEKGNSWIQSLLVEKGAEMGGKPFFFDAVRLGQTDVVKYLLHKNQDLIDAKNDNGETPLQVAERSGNDELIKFLENFNQE